MPTDGAPADPKPADPGSTTAPPGEDWAARATRVVGTGVELIRDKSVRPAFLVAAGIVVILGVIGSAVATLVLVAVGMTRLFDALVFSGAVWATYLLAGGIFVLLGAFVILWGERTSRSTA